MTDPVNRSARGKEISRPKPLRYGQSSADSNLFVIANTSHSTGSHHKGSSNSQNAPQPPPSEGRKRKDSMAAKALKSLHLKK